MHLPFLYARFHKQHHEFHSTVAISSEYLSVVEEITTGVIPTLCGPLFLKAHMGVIILWVAIRVAESADAHCGYALPWSVFAWGRPGDRHDYHHSQNDGNFGAFFTFWDWVCGTDKKYRAYLLKKKLSKVF